MVDTFRLLVVKINVIINHIVFLLKPFETVMVAALYGLAVVYLAHI